MGTALTRRAIRVACIGALLVSGITEARQSVDNPGLLPVPVPNLEAEEPAVRLQLTAERIEVDRILEAAEQRPEDAATAVGTLGSLYYLYDKKGSARVCFDNATRLAPEELRWHYLLAVIQTLDGEPERALAELDRVLRLDAKNVPAMIRSGRLRFDLAAYQAAKKSFESALVIEPENAAALGGLGKVEVLLGDAESAIPHLTRALALQPGADSLYYSLGVARRATGDLAGARVAFAKNKSGRLTFDDPLVAQIGRFSVSTEGLFHAGNRAMRRGDFSQAAELFAAYVGSHPDHLRARYNLAWSYLQIGRRQEGLDLLGKVLEVDPQIRDGRRLMADALAEGGELDASLVHYEEAHRLDPEDAGIVADWATVLAKVGREKEALELLSPFVAPEKQQDYARLKYATILATGGRGAEALPILEDIIASTGLRKGVRSEAYYHLGNLQLRGGDTVAAIESFEQALRLVPESKQASAALAPLLARGGEFARAAELYQTVVADQPDDQHAQFGLVMSLLLGGDDLAARTALEAALRALPDQLALRHLYARLLATSTDGSVRDGVLAVSVARELLRQKADPEFAQTLAMALAETDSFAEAVALQQQVVRRSEQARSSGAGVSEHEYQQQLRRLELYRSGQKVRAPWRPLP